MLPFWTLLYNIILRDWVRNTRQFTNLFGSSQETPEKIDVENANEKKQEKTASKLLMEKEIIDKPPSDFCNFLCFPAALNTLMILPAQGAA